MPLPPLSCGPRFTQSIPEKRASSNGIARPTAGAVVSTLGVAESADRGYGGERVVSNAGEYPAQPGRLDGTILIVDDDPYAARAFARLVRIAGGTSLIAVDCRSVLPLIKQPIAGLILDILLPDGSGFDLIPVVRARHPNAAVLVVTGAETPDFANKAHLLHVEYVRKPDITKNVNDFLARCAANARHDAARLISELRATHRLTDAEAKLVGASLRSSRKDAVADLLGVTASTVTQRTARVLHKTGFASLEELAVVLRTRLLKPSELWCPPVAALQHGEGIHNEPPARRRGQTRDGGQGTIIRTTMRPA